MDFPSCHMESLPSGRIPPNTQTFGSNIHALLCSAGAFGLTAFSEFPSVAAAGLKILSELRFVGALKVGMISDSDSTTDTMIIWSECGSATTSAMGPNSDVSTAVVFGEVPLSRAQTMNSVFMSLGQNVGYFVLRITVKYRPGSFGNRTTLKCMKCGYHQCISIQYLLVLIFASGSSHLPHVRCLRLLNRFKQYITW